MFFTNDCKCQHIGAPVPAHQQCVRQTSQHTPLQCLHNTQSLQLCQMGQHMLLQRRNNTQSLKVMVQPPPRALHSTLIMVVRSVMGAACCVTVADKCLCPQGKWEGPWRSTSHLGLLWGVWLSFCSYVKPFGAIFGPWGGGVLRRGRQGPEHF